MPDFLQSKEIAVRSTYRSHISNIIRSYIVYINLTLFELNSGLKMDFDLLTPNQFLYALSF